jgi:uncharacterized protein (TIGR00369 family)
MTADPDPDFASIAQRIRHSVGEQGFMALVGAELSELTRGTGTLEVGRRPELLQQHGLFHGGVTAFLVDNATTIAAATSRGQAALTAEYKLNLLSPATGERLICRARVIKPGRQVAVVAADVFCLTDGIEKTHRDGAGVDRDARKRAGKNFKPGLTGRAWLLNSLQ